MDPKVRKRLLKKKIVVIDTEINGNAVMQFSSDIHYLIGKGSPDFELRITSSGGIHGAGADISGEIKRYKGGITGYIYNRASSMAFLILQSCDRRVMFSSSYFCTHKIAKTWDDFFPRATSDVIEDVIKGKYEKELIEKINDLNNLDKKIAKFLSKKSNLSKKECLSLMKEDRDMYPEEALKKGFIDEVIKVY